MLLHGLSLVVSRGCSPVLVHSLLIAVASLCGAWAPGHMGSVVQWAGSAVAPYGLTGPEHVASSQTRDQTCVPRIGRQILNHWTTRKVQEALFFVLIDIGWFRAVLRTKSRRYPSES